jgi:hypothetical protein
MTEPLLKYTRLKVRTFVIANMLHSHLNVHRRCFRLFNQRDQPNPMEADGEQDEEEGLLSEMVGFMWSVFAW